MTSSVWIPACAGRNGKAKISFFGFSLKPKKTNPIKHIFREDAFQLEKTLPPGACARIFDSPSRAPRHAELCRTNRVFKRYDKHLYG